MSAVSLRPATPEDADRVFTWRNDPWIVSLSTSRSTVAWREHQAWFGQMMDRSCHLLFIVNDAEGTPSGTVRVDRTVPGEAVITIYLMRDYTGRGMGPQAIALACRAAHEMWPDLIQVMARIRADNGPSIKAFTRAGFQLAASVERPRDHVAMVWRAPRPEADPGRSPELTDDDQHTVDYFTALVDQFGFDPRALDWGSRESQRLRFAVLAGVGALDGASVLDVGCGLGDLYDWLIGQGWQGDYTGIDLTPRMIALARERFPDLHLEQRDLLTEPIGDGTFDYVMASGIFYLRRSEPFEYLQHMVEAMFRHCRRAVAFNSLSAWAPQQDPGEFYADPPATLSFARSLTPRLSLRHDYHPRDFTVFLYK